MQQSRELQEKDSAEPPSAAATTWEPTPAFFFSSPSGPPCRTVSGSHSFHICFYLFFVTWNRHDVREKIQIPAAFSFVYDECFKKHASLIFCLHVPARRSVAFAALCTMTLARARQQQHRLRAHRSCRVRARERQHMEGLICHAHFISERIFTAAKY